MVRRKSSIYAISISSEEVAFFVIIYIFFKNWIRNEKQNKMFEVFTSDHETFSNLLKVRQRFCPSVLSFYLSCLIVHLSFISMSVFHISVHLLICMSFFCPSIYLTICMSVLPLFFYMFNRNHLSISSSHIMVHYEHIESCLFFVINDTPCLSLKS